jgi:hypothetical protein
MQHLKGSKKTILEKQMAILKKDHDIAIDPYQKDLILLKWKDKVKQYAEIINENKKNK